MIDIQQAVTAIVNYYQGDPNEIRVFLYRADWMIGLSPLVDSILESVRDWLIPHDYDLTVPDVAEVLTWSDEL